MGAKIIYMEQTMIMVANGMKFPTDELLQTFLEETFEEKETAKDGYIYYVEKELNPSAEIES
jgi:hypothetical protein